MGMKSKSGPSIHILTMCKKKTSWLTIWSEIRNADEGERRDNFEETKMKKTIFQSMNKHTWIDDDDNDI